jgi:Glycosyl transferases group 1
MFTIDWPEPFGLAMIEALACGTPVIARPCGSVPEVLRNGVSGIVVTEFEDLVKAVKNIDRVSREGCRKEFETRFTADVMAAQYERIFYDLINTRRNGSSPHARFEERRLLAWEQLPSRSQVLRSRATSGNLWSPMNFLNPGLLGTQFKPEFLCHQSRTSWDQAAAEPPEEVNSALLNRPVAP